MLFLCIIDSALSYRHTPLQDLHNHPVVERAGVRLLIKREDLNHSQASGNKWWKLKYNLQAVAATSTRTLVTFGGPYSNHIYATAAAASALGLKSIGIIRGEEHTPLNPTLQFAVEKGMLLHYVDRDTYRNKSSQHFEEWIDKHFGNVIVIPEGGSNLLSVKGCAEFAKNELQAISFDHFYLAVGTGGTMAGIICGLENKKSIMGIPVLKGGGFLKDTIAGFVHEFSRRTYDNWALLTEFHHGGYGKTNKELMGFIEQMGTQYNIPLDHVYTGKLLWAVMRQIEDGAFRRGETILVLHSGGLQGSRMLAPPGS